MPRLLRLVRSISTTGLWIVCWVSLGVASSALQPPQSAESSAVRTERQLRTWQGELLAAGESPDLVRALSAPQWPLRVSGLECLVRLTRVGQPTPPTLLELVAEAQFDSHPNVRTAAFWLAAHDSNVALHVPRTLPDWPTEREALAACSWRQNVSYGALMEFLVDADERVRAAARGAWVRRELTTGEIERAVTKVGEAELKPLLRAARFGCLAELGVTAQPTPLAPAICVLLGGGTVADPDAFVRAWSEAPEWLHPFLIDASKASGAGLSATLLNALLTELDASPELRRLWNDAWSHTESSEQRLARLVRLPLARLPLDVLEEQLQVMEADAWPSGTMDWFEADWDADLRAEFVDAVARTERPQTGPAAAILLAALQNAELESSAFRVLSRRPKGHEQALFEALQRLPRDEALRRLDWFPASARLEPFLESLLALGEHADRRRNTAVRRLGAFDGQPEVLAAIRRWLTEDHLRLKLSQVDPSSTARPAVESRLVALAHALHLLLGTDAREAVLEVVRDAAPKSDDLTKELVVILARCDPSRASLTEFLGESQRTRTRVEAGIALSATDRGAAVLRELAGGGILATDLRLRAIEALGAHPTEVTREFLEDVAALPSTSEQIGIVAVDALGLGADAVPFLERLVLRAERFGVRRRAVVRLSANASLEGASAALSRLEPGLIRVSDPDEYRVLLREEWTLARVLTQPIHASSVDEAFREPRASFAADLLASWNGQRGAAAEFRWRTELAVFDQTGAAMSTAGVPRWRQVGGAFLSSAAGTMRPDLEPAVYETLQLLRTAASLAFQGEGAAAQARARERLWLAGSLFTLDAERAGRVYQALQADLAAGRLPGSALPKTLGPFDVDREWRPDPHAWFRSTLRLARPKLAAPARR